VTGKSELSETDMIARNRKTCWTKDRFDRDEIICQGIQIPASEFLPQPGAFKISRQEAVLNNPLYPVGCCTREHTIESW